MQSRLTKLTLLVMREKVKVSQLRQRIPIILPLVLQDRVQLKRYAINFGISEAPDPKMPQNALIFQFFPNPNKVPLPKNLWS